MPQFTYTPYVNNPATNSISELMLRRGDIAARQAEQVGAIQAHAAQQSGQAMAGAVANIGQIAAAVPGQIQQQQAFTQQRQLTGLQLQGAQRQQADVDALDKAYASGGLDRNAIINALPGHLRPTVQKQFTDSDEAAMKVQELKTKVNDAERDYFGSLAAGVQPFLAGEDHGLAAAMVALQHAKEKGYPDADQIWAHIKSDPSQLPTIINHLIAASPEQQKLINERATATARGKSADTSAARLTLETPKIQADTQTAQQNATGTQPITPFQQAELDNRAATLAREAKTQAETARHNRVTEGQTDPNAPVSDTAKGIAEYRIPPPSPRSMASGQGKALMDQVLRANPDYDASQFPTRSAMRKAFTSGSQSQSLTALNTALEHLGKLSDMSDALQSGSFKPGNAIYNAIRTTFGSAAVTNFGFARDIMSGELATAMKKSGATDIEISKVTKALSDAGSPEQLQGAIRTVAIPMISGKASTLDQQWKQVMGANDPFSVYTPGAKAVMDRMQTPATHDTGIAEGTVKPIPGFPGMEQTYKGGKWIRTK